MNLTLYLIKIHLRYELKCFRRDFAAVSSMYDHTKVKKKTGTGCDQVLTKKLWIFPSQKKKKKQREVVDTFKGERCVCMSSNRVWEKCLLRNSSKDF